jgi:hypothetical protein
LKKDEDKNLKMIRSDGKFLKEDFRRKEKGLVDYDEDVLRGKDLADDQERCRIHRRRL